MDENKSPSPFAKWDTEKSTSTGNKSQSPFAKWDTELPGVGNPTVDYEKKKFDHMREQKNSKPPPPKEIDENTGWGEVLKTSLSNIPSSSFRLLRDVVNSALSPIDSAKALYDVAAGGVEKAIPGGENKHTAAFDSVINHMKNRYGSEEGWKKAVALDPVGVLSDLSMVVMPAGGALKQAGKIAGKSNKLAKAAKIADGDWDAATSLSKSEIAEWVGDKMMRGGAHADPLTYPGKMTSAAIKNAAKRNPGKISNIAEMVKKVPGVGNILSKTAEGINSVRDPRKIMENNLKMKGIPPEQIQKMIDLAMKKELGPTAKSGNILEKMIKAEDAKIPGIIDENPGKIINTEDFKQFIPENTIDTRFADDRAIQKQTLDNFMVDDFIVDDSIGYRPNKITAKEGRSISDDLNKQFKDVKKGQLRGKDEHPTKVNTLDALRRGVIQTLYTAVPELKNVNKNLEEFISLKNALTEATNNIPADAKRTAISIAKNTALGGPKAGMAGLLKGIFNTPKVKIAYAALLNKLEKTGKRVSPAKQGVGQALVFPERAKDLDNIQPEIGEN